MQEKVSRKICHSHRLLAISASLMMPNIDPCDRFFYPRHSYTYSLNIENLSLILFQGYTNADNPFGDEHLLDTFVWSKKMEKEGIEHHDTDEIHNLQKKKMEENRVRVFTCTGAIVIQSC